MSRVFKEKSGSEGLRVVSDCLSNTKMKGFLALGVLLLVAVLLEQTQASSCSYSCQKSERYTTKCGWFSWSRCTKYRYRSSTCYKYCVHGNWTPWRTNLGSCSKTCGGGTQTVFKSRTCTKPRPSNGGRSCSGSSSSTTTQSCNTQKCPVHGGWSGWRYPTQTRCSATCGNRGTLTKTYTRTCTNPAPLYGGNQCSGAATRYEYKSCNRINCPVNGGWTDFRLLRSGNCNVTCGGGTKNTYYKRYCSNPSPRYGGQTCQGSTYRVDSAPCNTQHCPINGGWSGFELESEGSCTVTCGGGNKQMSYERTCTNPAPQYGGAICDGSDSKIESPVCNTQQCPIDGGWSSYTINATGACTVTCGGGEKILTYTRACDTPEPQYGGEECDGDDSREETQTCNTHHCPIHGGWTEYALSHTGDCSVTCGGGAKILTYSRTCTNPRPQYGGEDCDGDETMTDEEVCNENPCPVNGGWTEFSAWEDDDECDVLCGGGNKGQSRSRTCTNPEPAYGGSDCEGDQVEQQTIECNAAACGDKCPTGQVNFINHANNMNRYYQCAHGIARLRDCAVGAHWSQDSMTCVNDQVEEDEAPTHAPVVSTCTAGNIADPENCLRYKMCVSGRYLSMPCPAGTGFNPATSACDFLRNIPNCSN